MMFKYMPKLLNHIPLILCHKHHQIKLIFRTTDLLETRPIYPDYCIGEILLEQRQNRLALLRRNIYGLISSRGTPVMVCQSLAASSMKSGINTRYAWALGLGQE